MRQNQERVKNFFGAIDEGDIVAARNWLDRGVDVNSVLEGHTALGRAFGSFRCPPTISTEIINMLLERGVALTTQEWRENGVDVSGWTVLHELMETSNCPEELRIELIRRILKSGEDVNSRVFKNNSYYPNATPLHLAASHNELEISKLLLSHGADLEARDGYGATPLMYSLDTSGLYRIVGPDVARFLISQGADVNSRDEFMSCLEMAMSSRERNGEDAEIIGLLKAAGAI